MNRLLRVLLIILLFPPALAAIGGWLAGPSFLHPNRRTLSPDLIQQADVTFQQIGVERENLEVRAPDGALLRGWKVRAAQPNGNWLLLYHGAADNRVGVVGQTQLLLEAGYGVVMMDARAHGDSEGSMATYGWLERNDSRSIVEALERSEHPQHLFALGESMGAGIALQSAAVEPRIEAVVAEAPFADIREASYDYAGLRRDPWLGKTWLALGTWTMIYRGESIAGFPASQVSPKQAVATRKFPVLLICDAEDVALPCRHTKMIYDAAVGPKEMWVVPRAYHTAALGFAPVEFRRRVLAFLTKYSALAGPHFASGR